MMSVRGNASLCPSARLCPYSICFLDVYLVSRGDGLTTKRRQPLWTSVHISGSMPFRTHVYWTFFFSYFGGYYHLSKYSTLFKHIYTFLLSRKESVFMILFADIRNMYITGQHFQHLL